MIAILEFKSAFIDKWVVINSITFGSMTQKTAANKIISSCNFSRLSRRNKEGPESSSEFLIVPFVDFFISFALFELKLQQFLLQFFKLAVFLKKVAWIAGNWHSFCLFYHENCLTYESVRKIKHLNSSVFLTWIEFTQLLKYFLVFAERLVKLRLELLYKLLVFFNIGLKPWYLPKLSSLSIHVVVKNHLL